jgi:hypothetical protein
VLDQADTALAGAIQGLGLRTLVTDTLMRDTGVSERLSREVLAALHR